MGEDSQTPQVSKVIRFGAGFIAVSGLVGAFGGVSSIVKEPQDRAIMGLILTICLFFIYVLGYVAWRGSVPKFRLKK